MVENNKQEANEHGIVVFGRKKETSDKSIDDLAKTEDKKETIDLDKVDDVNIDKQKETDVVIDQEKAEEAKSEKTDIDKEDKEKEQGKPTFKVIPKEENKSTAKEEVKETAPISDEKLVEVLKSRGINITSLADLSKKEETLSDAVSEFKKFNENTGRGIDAYYNSKRDWSKEDHDTTIKEYLKYQEPLLTDEDIDRELSLLKLSEEDKEEMSPREITKSQQEYNKTYAKALGYMKNVSKEYSLPAKQENIQEQKQPTAEEIAEAHKPYWESRDKSLEKLNEISINFEGLGELKANLSQEHKDLIAQSTQTQADFFKRWQDNKGVINTDKSSLDIAWSIPEIRNELISEYLIQAHTKMKEQDSKTRRNVTIDSKKQKIQEEIKKGMTTFNSNQSTSKMGTPLIPSKRS